MTKYSSYPNSMQSSQNLVSKFMTKFSTGSAVVMAIAIACCTPTMPVRAALFDGPVDRLPAIERDSLRNGQTVVTGEKGKYVARVLVTASPDAVWRVLTDYANLSKFIPNMTSSKVLESYGNRKVIEQVDTRQVFIVSIVSRTKLAIEETDRKQIDFRLIDGDLSKMEGYWKIEPVSAIPNRPANQVLITYTVNAQPSDSTPADAFYGIFKDALNDTLQAIKNEIKSRG
ncbi:SRPBCC family protein [Pseudanabaena sp. Chao 1811]|uniref:SRPBCC family protein n=1 Tax=Pseudanabaena sp. Chao 1811 TaxID=2963092 RepID=UPI0022F3F01C|nr:SRPBCC family protein [Pseudanabaena sp. Chao 1811]